jgi:hypothetical protein
MLCVCLSMGIAWRQDSRGRLRATEYGAVVPIIHKEMAANGRSLIIWISARHRSEIFQLCIYFLASEKTVEDANGFISRFVLVT